MTDITKCYGEEPDGSNKCPVRDTCWRYLAPADRLYQSWFAGLIIDGSNCEEYWEVKQDDGE